MYKETILSFQKSGLKYGGQRYEHYLLPFYKYLIYLHDMYETTLSQHVFCGFHFILFGTSYNAS